MLHQLLPHAAPCPHAAATSSSFSFGPSTTTSAFGATAAPSLFGATAATTALVPAAPTGGMFGTQMAPAAFGTPQPPGGAADGAVRQIMELKAAYTPSAPSYKFQHLFLNVVGDPNQRVKPAGVDEMRWRQAMAAAGGQDNPDRWGATGWAVLHRPRFMCSSSFNDCALHTGRHHVHTHTHSGAAPAMEWGATGGDSRQQARGGGRGRGLRCELLSTLRPYTRPHPEPLWPCRDGTAVPAVSPPASPTLHQPLTPSVPHPHAPAPTPPSCPPSSPPPGYGLWRRTGSRTCWRAPRRRRWRWRRTRAASKP